MIAPANPRTTKVPCNICLTPFKQCFKKALYLSPHSTETAGRSSRKSFKHNEIKKNKPEKRKPKTEYSAVKMHIDLYNATQERAASLHRTYSEHMRQLAIADIQRTVATS